MDHDVILVSGNYRVGPLGFLSTEDRFAPGNTGFKDQTFILKWIQENIEHFEGDKNSVTIWGGKILKHYFYKNHHLQNIFRIGWRCKR